MAKENKKDFIEYLSTGRGLLIFASIVVFISAFILSLYFPVIFKVPEALAFQSQVLFLLITTAFTFSIPNIVFWAVLYAKQRFDLINASVFFGLVLRAGSLFVLYSILPPRYVSLTTYGLVYLLMTLLQNQLIYIWKKKILPGSRVRLGAFKLDKVKEILSFSFHTSVSRLSSLLSNNLLDVLINLFWGAAFNTMYSIGFKFPTLMSRLFQDATWTLTPSFTELVAKKEHDKVKRLLFAYTKLIAVLVMPLGLLLAGLAQPVIHLWVGDGFEQAAKILTISAVPLVVAIPFAVVGCISTAYGKVKVPSRVALLVAIFNVVGAVLLGKVFSQGLAGIAMASAAASVIYFTLFSPYYACRIAGISLSEYLVHSFLKPFGWSVLTVGGSISLLKVATHGRPVTTAETVILAVLLPVGCYLGAYFVVLNSKERRNVKGMWQEIAESFQSIFKKKSMNALDPLVTKIRVLHVIKTLALGGAETNLLNLVNAMAPERVETHVAYSWGGEIESRFKEKGVRLFKYADASHKIKSFATIGIVFRLVRYILENKIQVVHTHVFNAHAWAGAAARLTGRKVVEHVHDFRYIDRSDRESGGCFIDQFRHTKTMARLSDGIIVLTEQNRWFIAQNHLHRSEKVWLTRNGISLDPPKSKLGAEPYRKWGISPDRKIILTPARMSAEKNIDLLFKVAARVVKDCPEAMFVVAGDGPLLEDYKKRVLSEGLEDRLLFIGFQKNIQHLLSRTYAMILPSFLELHPISILEALSEKVPVLVSKDVGCNSEVFTHAQDALLLDPHRPQDWAEAVIALIRDPERRQRIGQNGFELCRNKFDIRKTAAQIEAVYKNLIR